MTSLFDSQRKENIHIDVLEGNQGPERAASKCQGREQTSLRVCSLQSPVSPEDTSRSNASYFLLESQPSHASACVNIKCHFFLDFMSPKMMDLLLSDPAVSLFDLEERRSFLS